MFEPNDTKIEDGWSIDSLELNKENTKEEMSADVER